MIKHSFQHTCAFQWIYVQMPNNLIDHSSFLSKLYSNCLKLLRRSGVGPFKLSHYFLFSQVYYMLGDNPKKMSYTVGFGNKYPTQVHHRVASNRWDDQNYSCPEGDRRLSSKEQNPNILYGAMVAGPDKLDNFLDERKVMVHRATIASNADLVVALKIFLLNVPNGLLNLSTFHTVDGESRNFLQKSFRCLWIYSTSDYKGCVYQESITN
ncbi:hypothetical protein POTOM_009752 [Populus tomentosa]|uniref:Glycoside hydrolase family 9 domain-containing protein n=1 Tax=Populus tomentosa TaxID=118781 RepID=A0A8X8DBZ7_POPTO|nr:hypothetical protein POTOM_009752 [Populus tomentosa]